MADEWTIGTLLQWTTDYLKQHGAESPRLEAELLLAHARGCGRVELYTSFGDQADEALRTKYRELVKRRADGVPVAYLVGHREFYSLSFRVTPDVLIPRPETEFLVITAMDLLRERARKGPANVCDVGTGSGIIAVCLAKHVADGPVLIGQVHSPHFATAFVSDSTACSAHVAATSRVTGVLSGH